MRSAGEGDAGGAEEAAELSHAAAAEACGEGAFGSGGIRDLGARRAFSASERVLELPYTGMSLVAQLVYFQLLSLTR